jgi:hypothetical protein
MPVANTPGRRDAPMLKLSYLELGEPGLAYIRERLGGGKSLSHLLLAGIDLQQGTAWTYLPTDLPPSATVQFDEGVMRKRQALAEAAGVLLPEDVRPHAVLGHITLRFLHAFPTGIVVREDGVAAASDPGVRLRVPEASVVFVEEEVYSVAQGETATQKTLRVALESLDAWWGEPVVLAVLPEPALRPFGQSGATIAPEALQPLVDHLQLLAFNAYDGEAYLYWSPPRSLVDTSLSPQST